MVRDGENRACLQDHSPNYNKMTSPGETCPMWFHGIKKFDAWQQFAKPHEVCRCDPPRRQTPKPARTPEPVQQPTVIDIDEIVEIAAAFIKMVGHRKVLGIIALATALGAVGNSNPQEFEAARVELRKGASERLQKLLAFELATGHAK